MQQTFEGVTQIYQFNPLVGLSGILLLLPFLRFLHKTSGVILILGIYILLSFAEGSLDLLGLLPPSLNRIFRDLLIFIIFLKGINQKREYTKAFVLFTLIFVVISFIQTYLGDTNYRQLLQYLRRFLMLFFTIYVIANIKVHYKQFSLTIKLILVFFLIQIVANIYKFFLEGISEPYIGTISKLGGSMTTYVALFGLTYCYNMFKYKKAKIYLVYSFLFIVFGLIGAKKIIFIFAPIIVFLIEFNFIRFSGAIQKTFGAIFKAAIYSSIVIYLFVKIHPDLNKENSNWGSFDIDYLIEYSDRYNDYKGKGGDSDGRFKALSFYFSKINFDVGKVLNGLGPGSAFPANSNEIDVYGTGERYILTKYGFGYGFRVGYIFVFFQVGLLGLLTICIGYYKIIKRVKHNLKTIRNNMLKNIVITLNLIVLIDFFVYSSVFITPNAVTNTWLIVVGFVLNQEIIKGNYWNLFLKLNK